MAYALLLVEDIALHRYEKAELGVISLGKKGSHKEESITETIDMIYEKISS